MKSPARSAVGFSYDCAILGFLEIVYTSSNWGDICAALTADAGSTGEVSC